jgi:hypothetical protein
MWRVAIRDLQWRRRFVIAGLATSLVFGMTLLMTVLSALAAILRPAAGAVRVGDVEVTGLRGAALTHYRRHRVGSCSRPSTWYQASAPATTCRPRCGRRGCRGGRPGRAPRSC